MNTERQASQHYETHKYRANNSTASKFLINFYDYKENKQFRMGHVLNYISLNRFTALVYNNNNEKSAQRDANTARWL